MARDAAADRDARGDRDRRDDAHLRAVRALPGHRPDLGGGAADPVLRVADPVRDHPGAGALPQGAGRAEPDRDRAHPDASCADRPGRPECGGRARWLAAARDPPGYRGGRIRSRAVGVRPRGAANRREPLTMASEPTTEETETLRSRLDALEREHHDRMARANEALAAAQDRSYWLERWGVDLNSLMRRRGAAEVRAGLRALRSVYRMRYRVAGQLRSLPVRASLARQAVEEERALAGEEGVRPEPRTLSPDSLESARVTDLLYERLTDADIASVEEHLSPGEQALWETATASDRRRLTLAFAAHHGLEGALERTGLSAAMPDPGVHAMASGPAATGGSTYYADLVADSLSATGLELEDVRSALDFGCSSGRVVRVLAAAFPDVEWHGCDPIPDAIEWASAHLPGIEFRLSGDHPPLPYDDGAFDAVFAISIWSHFAEQAALDWLAEMHRIVRPGGRLVLTTHGEQTIVHTAREGLRSQEQLDGVRGGLAQHGYWYAAEFGEAGDHGVTNPEWGTAFLSAEWLAAKVTPRWRVSLFRPGRVELNQDLYVLERV